MKLSMAERKEEAEEKKRGQLAYKGREEVEKPRQLLRKVEGPTFPSETRS